MGRNISLLRNPMRLRPRSKGERDDMLERATGRIITGLGKAVARMPDDFYGSFAYTRTGNNLCHPVTLGALASVISTIDGIAYVGIDVRLNGGGGVKFQPDLVGFYEDGSYAIYVDFESPNSSDARVPGKDVSAYLRWAEVAPTAPYIIVTSLPDVAAPNWELRWTADGYYNEKHRDRRADIRANPFRYWSAAWQKAMAGWDLSHIAFLNISGRKIERVVL